MLSLLITLLIVALVVGLVFWILGLLPIPQPWMNVAKAIVGVIVLIYLIEMLLPLANGGLHPLIR